MKYMTFSRLSDRLKDVFMDESTFEGFKNLRFDLNNKTAIKDNAGHTITNTEAEDQIRRVVFRILDLPEKNTRRDRVRALREHGTELFAIIEEEIDFKIARGFGSSMLFKTLVDRRDISKGDLIEFETKEDVYLTVSETADGHHDHTVQRLGKGRTFTPSTHAYNITVGTDLDMYLTGRASWVKLTDACASAMVRKVQDDILAAMVKACEMLPEQFKGTGELVPGLQKDKFDEIIENVSIANDDAPVVIIGTKMALKKITKLEDVEWATPEMKEALYKKGRLGYYEGNVLLIELPQRFSLHSLDKKVLDSKRLAFLPLAEDKPIKMVDVGETIIYEQTERGDRFDDTMKHEVTRIMGIGVQLGRYFGSWTIA